MMVGKMPVNFGKKCAMGTGCPGKDSLCGRAGCPVSSIPYNMRIAEIGMFHNAFYIGIKYGNLLLTAAFLSLDTCGTGRAQFLDILAKKADMGLYQFKAIMVRRIMAAGDLYRPIAI